MNSCTAHPLRTTRLTLALVAALALTGPALAADHGHGPASTKPATAKSAPAEAPAKAVASAAPAGSPEAAAEKVRQVIDAHKGGKATVQVKVNSQSIAKVAAAGSESGHASPQRMASLSPAAGAHGAHAEPATASGTSSREYIKARAAALAGHGPADSAGHGNGHEAHWAYEGENGPQKWGAMKPEFNVCAIGKRQSPIHIEETATLPGPAEPLQISYQPSGGSVVNNGHTIQVDLEGDNTLTVRGSVYKLVQFHFHHPAEEKVNYKGFAMVAHLVHRNDAGQLAVVAVLMDPGAANPLIHNVWTHMPLDTADRVKLPAGAIDMNKLLPQDQRYYQFIGSLTTPPCTEGVLWLVLKQPMTLARDQLKMFSALFPNNARPTQPLHGRLVREAQ